MSDVKEFISWRTAQNSARRKLQKTGKTQAIYFMPGKIYKTMPMAMWRMGKPGTLAYTIENPCFDGTFRKTEL